MHSPLSQSFTPSSVSSDRRLWRNGLLLVVVSLAGLTTCPLAQAVTPAPDGGYPNNNTAEGTNALLKLTTGTDNTACGSGALSSNTTGDFNTASGSSALSSNSTGDDNTATSATALQSNTTGFSNTATGALALFVNSIGNNNTATGVAALLNNSTGSDNTANGVNALNFNLSGNNNTATGSKALFSNDPGGYNTATGFKALYSSTNANYNTATGALALLNDTGVQNTATGTFALQNNAGGQNNTATGLQALFNNTSGSSNTADGMNALVKNTTGTNNIGLGVSAGSNLTTGNNNIDIGAPGVAGEAGKIRIGKSSTASGTFIAGISGKTVASGVGVIVNSSGQLGTVQSSARFKDDIKPMDKASEVVLKLKPVTFRYKEELDPDKIPQFGLIAEDVEKVNPDLVVRDDNGNVTTVRYEAVNAMLLNEFLKQHRKAEEQNRRLHDQEATITQLKTGMEAVVAHLEEQDSKINQVSTRVELSKPASQVVLNDQ